MKGLSRLDTLKHAVSLWETKNKAYKLPDIQKVKETKIYNDKSSVNLTNDDIRENIDIAYARMIFPEKNIIKYDGEVQKHSRNPLILTDTSKFEPAEESQSMAHMNENIKFNRIGDIYQEESNAADEKLVRNRKPEVPASEKGAILTHFISQVKFLMKKADDENAKKRLQRLLDYFYSGNDNVTKLGLSAKNKVTEGEFDSDVTFQQYLNYIITPDSERLGVKKPGFYDELFGKYIEKEQHPSKAWRMESRPHTTIVNASSTIELRQYLPRTKDSEVKNNKWLKTFCKKITSLDDVITSVSSIGFCLNGPTIDETVFDKQLKQFFKVFKDYLEDEAY